MSSSQKDYEICAYPYCVFLLAVCICKGERSGTRNDENRYELLQLLSKSEVRVDVDVEEQYIELASTRKYVPQ